MNVYHYALHHRLHDALCGLLDGSIVIGGHDARGLQDSPVLAALYDLGFIEFVPDLHVNVRALTDAGHDAALHDLNAIEFTPRTGGWALTVEGANAAVRARAWQQQVAAATEAHQ